MTRTVRLRSVAEADVRDAYQWYEEQAHGLGDAFLRAADAALAAIQRHTEATPKVYATVRHALLRRFPYVFLDVIESGAITVLACFHVRRDPKSWHDHVLTSIDGDHGDGNLSVRRSFQRSDGV